MSHSNSEQFQPVGLGDRVKDPITGLTGIITVVSTWLHGCIRVGVQPEEVRDGKPVEDRYFDQSQVVLVERRVYQPMVLGVIPAPEPEARRSNGGPEREGRGFRR